MHQKTKSAPSFNKYMESYPNVIQYYRNEVNIGFDRNVDLVVKRATGKFVWILSDDDYIGMEQLNLSKI